MATPAGEQFTPEQQDAISQAVAAALEAHGVTPAAEETETAHVPILERLTQLTHDVEHDTNELKLDTLTKEGYASDPIGALAEIVFALAAKIAPRPR